MIENFGQKLREILLSSDIYGQSIIIHLGKKRKHKTYIGSFFTFLTAMIVAGALYYLLSEMIQKKNPTVIELENILSNEDEYFNSIEQIKFGLTFYNKQGELINNKLSIQEIQRSLQFGLYCEENSNGIIDIQSDQGRLSEYQDDPNVVYIYPDLTDEDVKNLFNRRNKKNTYQWRLQVQIKESVLQTEAVYWKLTYFDSIADLENSRKPIQIFQKDQQYELNLVKRNHIQTYFRKKKLVSDDGWIIQEISNDETIQQEDTNESPLPNNLSLLYEVEFILNRKIYIVKRSYIKIQSILTQIGGLLKVVVLFFHIVSYPLAKLSLQLELVNSVFQFEDQINEINKGDFPNTQNNQKDKEDIQNPTPDHKGIASQNMSNFSRQKFKIPSIYIDKTYQIPQEYQNNPKKITNEGSPQVISQSEAIQNEQVVSQIQNTPKERKSSIFKTTDQRKYSLQQNQQSQISKLGENIDFSINQNTESIALPQVPKEGLIKKEMTQLEANQNEQYNNTQNGRNSIFKGTEQKKSSFQQIQQNQLSKRSQNIDFSNNDSIAMSIPKEGIIKKEILHANTEFLKDTSNQIESRVLSPGNGNGRSRAQSNSSQQYPYNNFNSNKSLYKTAQEQKSKLIKKLVQQKFQKIHHNSNTPESPLKTVEFKQARHLVNGKKSEDFNSIFTKLFKTISHNYLVMKLLDKVKYLFRIKFPKQQQLKFSMEKIRERLDIIFIIKKIVEIDKLKMVLFDQNQLKIFEYLPRPIIKFDPYSIEEKEKKELEQKKYCMENLRSGNNVDSSQRYDENNIHELWQYALIESDKPYFQKVQEAAKAYEQLNKKENKDKYDMRLLQFLDSSRRNYFEEILRPSSPSSSQSQQQKLQDMLSANRAKLIEGKENELQLDSIPENNNSNQNITQLQIPKQNNIPQDNNDNLAEEKDDNQEKQNIVQHIKQLKLMRYMSESENLVNIKAKTFSHKNIQESLNRITKQNQSELSITSSNDLGGGEFEDIPQIKQTDYMHSINKFQSYNFN